VNSKAIIDQTKYDSAGKHFDIKQKFTSVQEFAYKCVLTKCIPPAATLSMLRVANAIYSVLELACKGNRKVAPAFMEHMGIFDRHLGTQVKTASQIRLYPKLSTPNPNSLYPATTQVKSAMLMRELYCNRQMLVTPTPDKDP